jgi:hypothetical protein
MKLQHRVWKTLSAFSPRPKMELVAMTAGKLASAKDSFKLVIYRLHSSNGIVAYK